MATLVVGPGVCICDGCPALCSHVIAGKPASVAQIAHSEHGTTLDEVLANLTPLSAAGAKVEGNLTAWVAKARASSGPRRTRSDLDGPSSGPRKPVADVRERHLSGDRTRLARVNFDIPRMRPERFRLVYREVDQPTREIVASGSRDEHSVSHIALRRLAEGGAP